MVHALLAVLGPCYGAAELALSLWRRSRRHGVARDGGSLRLIWIVVLASVALAAGLASGWPAGRLPAALGTAGIAVFVAGVALRGWAIVHLGRFFTVDVAVMAGHRLVSDGPYRFVRHPSYTGMLLAFAGLGLASGSLPALLVLTLPVGWAVGRRIAVEEAVLRAEFGADYERYAARTRRLLPFIY